jgi:hypothetical protein
VNGHAASLFYDLKLVPCYTQPLLAKWLFYDIVLKTLCSVDDPNQILYVLPKIPVGSIVEES